MDPPEGLPLTSLAESDSHESPSIARKRKSSTNDVGVVRTIKHRSSQACQSCRMRKVRCDVIVNGTRCTNCRLDDTECVVLASRRGKNNHTNSRSSTNQVASLTPQPVKVFRDSGPETAKANNRPSSEVVDTPTTQSTAGHVPASVTFDQDSDRPRSSQPPETDENTENETEAPSPEACDGLTASEPGTNHSNQYQSPAVKASLPAFITPLSSRIPNDDLDFLVQKGALLVPEPELRVEILRGYLFSIHPFMPMLDFRTFAHAILDNHKDGTISLLLFQAVMFAGVNSLRPHVIHRLGFKSVKQARKVYFARVKLLYDFEIEMNDAAVLQSLILMSLWYGKWDDRRHTWHWTGLAYDVARSMGLHREPTTKHSSDKVRRFRRRLWWSLYIRDRMIALGTRRPMRIRDDDFEVAMLTLDDFDLGPLDELGQGDPLTPSVEANTSTALMCIELVKLCTFIGHVMSSQYTVLNTQADIPHTMMVVSKRTGSHTQELESCDRELQEWFQELGNNVRRNGSPSVENDVCSCSEVHWAILNMTYLTVVNVLHRSQALQPMPDAAEAQTVRRKSRSKVKEAARSLTKLSQTMLRQDEVRFLGPIGVTALVAACLSHMLDISAGDDEDVRDASTFRLYQSLQVLQSLREIYAAADASVSFLASVTRKSGIPIPTHFAAPAADLSSGSNQGLVDVTRKDSRQSSSTEPLVWPSDKRAKLNEHSYAFGTNYNPSPPQSSRRSTNDHLQPQSLLNRYGQGVTTSNVMQHSTGTGEFGASTVAGSILKDIPVSSHKPTDTMRDSTNSYYQADHFTTTGFGGPSSLPVDESFLDWNNAMDTGMDFGSMAFNYDYHSDPFGFSENISRGI